MKIYLIVFFISFNFNLNAQHYVIPEFSLTLSNAILSSQLEKLNIEDTSALTISLSGSGYWIGGSLTHYITFSNDGQVDYSKCYYPWDKKKNVELTKYRINDELKKEFWEFLNTNSEKKNFTLKQSLLNKTEKPGPNGTSMSINISDGNTYNLTLFKNNKYAQYSSFEPRTYIANKYPGYEERQKFLSLFESLSELIEKVNSKAK